MKANVISVEGKKSGEVSLPRVFSSGLRPDLVRRSVLAIQSNKRQPYGTDPEAGKRSSAHYHAKRHYRYSMMNKDLARLPRIHGDSALPMRVRNVPQSIKGRKAHPPKAEKDFSISINKKENRLAIRSAIAATADQETVSGRGHKAAGLTLPIVVEDKFTALAKTSDAVKAMKAFGLEAELERASVKKVRAGKGTMRGRRYNKKKGPLVVVSGSSPLVKACRNIPGVDVESVENLNCELLAPGADMGRLVIWTKGSIERLAESGLF